MKKYGIKALQYSLGLLLFLVLLYFVVGELIGKRETVTSVGTSSLLEASWERVYTDGTREPVTLPDIWDAEPGEEVRAEAVLPELTKDMYGSIRASQQDMWIYVDGELRENYSTEGIRPFGKTSASAYVFFPLYKEDAGKMLAIVTVSDSAYSGRMNQVIVGEKLDLANHYMRENAWILVVAFTMVILSIITVVTSFLLGLVHKKQMELLYLGLGTLITSLIMIAESLIRQFVLPSITVASDMGFFLTMLAPYPFLIYANLVQKKRYEKFYIPVLLSVVLNTVISFVLHVWGIVDLLETMIADYVIIGIALAVGMGTILTDIVKKRIKEYWEIGVGLIGIILASGFEIYQVYTPGARWGGFAFCAGLCFLLVMAAFKTGRDMQAMEQEKQRAIVTGEAKTQFLAQMSHEIRTPINTIIGMNEMVLRESKEDSVREYAENIESSSRMLLGLINDVLDFSKIEAGKLDLTVGRYTLPKLLDSVAQELKFKVEAKALKVVVDVEEHLPRRLLGDEVRIRQILSNLVSNAVKYTMEGQITFTVKGIASENGFALQCSVKDTGIGIREEDIPRLFDSFQRVEERKNRHIEGTGLGLAITKQLTELMNGTISVESEYGKGSCFTVTVPQGISEESYSNAAQKEGAQEPEQKKEQKQPLYAPEAVVLAVDDNEMNRKVVQMLLRRTGIQVEVASGGTECLELCRQKKYDVILMDHMMPEPDGIETLHLLRKDEESQNRDTEVLVLTANAVAGSEEQYLAEGFAGYLSKPLVVADLEEMLRNHLPEGKVIPKPAE